MPDASPRLGLVTMSSRDGLTTEQDRTGRWLDRLFAHLWWAALLAGGILCVLALVLT